MFRAEYIAVILGVVVVLCGAALMYDARGEDRIPVLHERRRRARAPRDRPGEALVGLGMIFLGAALVGRENWRFGTLAMFAGFALLLVGAVLNRGYLKELLLFRGAARRTSPGQKPPTAPPPSDGPRPRIR